MANMNEMAIASDTGSTVISSHRLYETPDHYAARLRSARMRTDERWELNAYYDAIDAERAASGLPPAEREDWSPADILEWRDLTPGQRYLNLQIYVRACDRARTAATSSTAA